MEDDIFQMEQSQKWNLKRGDKVENIWASEQNPIKYGKFLGFVHRKDTVSISSKGRISIKKIMNKGIYAKYSSPGRIYSLTQPDSLKVIL